MTRPDTFPAHGSLTSEILRLARIGYTPKEIAAKLGCDRRYVCTACRRHNVAVRYSVRGGRRRFTDLQIADIRSDPSHNSDLAEQYDVSEATISNIRSGTTYKHLPIGRRYTHVHRVGLNEESKEHFERMAQKTGRSVSLLLSELLKRLADDGLHAELTQKEPPDCLGLASDPGILKEAEVL